jgi:Tol biopolymer transport system component
MTHRATRRPGRSRTVVGVALLAVLALVGACGPNTSGSPKPSSSQAVATSPDATTLASPSPAPSPSPSPLPGAGRIVFAQFQGTEDNFNVYSMNADGSDLKLLLGGNHAIPRWSFDGRRVAVTTSSFGSGQFETIVNADGTGARDLVRPDPSLALTCNAWSPDGTRLVCEGWQPGKRGREGLYTVRTSDGGGLTRLTTTTQGIHDIPADYSPDGTKILFIRATYTPLKLGQIWICDADGKNAHKLTDTLTGYRVSWSRDGRYVAGAQNGQILIFDLTDLTAQPRAIKFTDGAAYTPRFSPDGKRIVYAFIRKSTTTHEIYTVNFDGSDRKRLTTNIKRDEYPDWGPSF